MNVKRDFPAIVESNPSDVSLIEIRLFYSLYKMPIAREIELKMKFEKASVFQWWFINRGYLVPSIFLKSSVSLLEMKSS